MSSENSRPSKREQVIEVFKELTSGNEREYSTSKVDRVDLTVEVESENFESPNRRVAILYLNEPREISDSQSLSLSLALKSIVFWLIIDVQRMNDIRKIEILFVYINVINKYLLSRIEVRNLFAERTDEEASVIWVFPSPLSETRTTQFTSCKTHNQLS